MSQIALGLDDSALAIARDGDLVSTVPSIVQAVAGARPVGAPALDLIRLRPRDVSSRHWAQLVRGDGDLAAAARLARAELAARAAAAGIDVGEMQGLQVAVPAHFDAAALGRVLAVLRAAGWPVAGFVDAAAVLCAALGTTRTTIVIDVGLHHLSAARVTADGDGVRRRAVRARAGQGLLALQESWLLLVSEAMVLRSRFDPLHEAATEQRLYELLEGAAAAAARDGGATISLPVGAQTYEVRLSRDQFATRANGLYRELLALVHELRPAGAALTLLVPERIAALPGLREMFDTLHGCDWVVLPAGYAAVAASLLESGPADAAAAVRLLRHLPRLDTPPYSSAIRREALGNAALQARAPTHLLHAGRALPLTAATIEIGRAPGPGGLALPEGVAGLSRLHCTVRDDHGEPVLIDHSRHGSFVNGERVAGRVRLHAGDTLRLGDPGVEMALIAVGDAPAAGGRAG